MISYVVAVVFLAVAGVADATIECLYCQSAPNITDCYTNRITCGDGEFCYLEKVTTTQLKVAFNAGCRSKTVCDLMASLATPSGKREAPELSRDKKDLVNCAECCDLTNTTGPCNAYLCNQKPPLQAGCLSCNSLVAGPDQCTNREVCQDTQVCANAIYIVANEIRYKYYCEERHLCELFHGNKEPGHIVGKVSKKKKNTDDKGIPVCNACCVGNECNKENCVNLQKTIDSSVFTTQAPGGR